MGSGLSDISVSRNLVLIVQGVPHSSGKDLPQQSAQVSRPGMGDVYDHDCQQEPMPDDVVGSTALNQTTNRSGIDVAPAGFRGLRSIPLARCSRYPAVGYT
jgi:hypothetical protein